MRGGEGPQAPTFNGKQTLTRRSAFTEQLYSRITLETREGGGERRLQSPSPGADDVLPPQPPWRLFHSSTGIVAAASLHISHLTPLVAPLGGEPISAENEHAGHNLWPCRVHGAGFHSPGRSSGWAERPATPRCSQPGRHEPQSPSTKRHRGDESEVPPAGAHP